MLKMILLMNTASLLLILMSLLLFLRLQLFWRTGTIPLWHHYGCGFVVDKGMHSVLFFLMMCLLVISFLTTMTLAILAQWGGA